ncbi:MAG: DUF3800 domain-containing protein [Nitrosopumilus sp.]|nr:DUF3800 domain-containing protein [Nitrosopumilus sp.]
MPIMYVDESGSFHHNDKTKYFVLSGVVVSDDKIKHLQTASYQYKLKHFNNEYIDSEIHTHDIYKAKGDFTSLTLSQKQELLHELYTTINELDISTVSVIIDKDSLKTTYPTWKVFNTAWIFLIERFDKILEEKFDDAKGSIKIDKSSSRFHKDILDILNDLRKNGTSFQRKACIDHRVFVESSAVEGIQIADAVAYCSFMYKQNHTPFANYWNMIYPKFRKSDFGTVSGYGLKEFP